ncbi:TolB family protein [Glaciecola sp. 2405UD65-10]|uniref:TolB family protein n=1 Tax=Glaciecola sp. 2405UD65-10 TaxID=3397244 RepID=UPI003B5CD74D
MKTIIPKTQKISLSILFFGLFSCTGTHNSVNLETSSKATKEIEVAYLSSQSGNLELYLKNLDTNKLTQITNNTLDDLNPVWSPSGKQLAFIGRTLTSTFLNVYDTTSQKTSTLVDESLAPAWLSWSPLSNKIVFVSNKANGESLYTVDLDGNKDLVLHSTEGTLVSPKYSRDGSVLAVIENDSLSVVTSASVKNMMFPKKFRVLDFDWGANNKTLYVTARVDRKINIHKVDLDTLETEVLIEGPYLDVEARFFPPNKIAFLSSRLDGGTRQLFMFNTDEKSIQQLTPEKLEVMHPNWSPSGKYIAYTTPVGKHFSSMILDIDSGDISPVSLGETGFHLLPTIRP